MKADVKPDEAAEEMDVRRFKKSYYFVVVIAVAEFDLNRIWLTSGEFAR